jgi:hypothetical protein
MLRTIFRIAGAGEPEADCERPGGRKVTRHGNSESSLMSPFA